jgi:hypothetical protein
VTTVAQHPGLASVVRLLSGDAHDYDAILDLVGDARVVLIGEASRGTHEFYRKRAAIRAGDATAAVDPLAHLRVSIRSRPEGREMHDLQGEESAGTGRSRWAPTWTAATVVHAKGR